MSDEKIMVCPVMDCAWQIDTTPPTTGDGVLADIFGPGVMALHHRNTVAIEIITEAFAASPR